MYLFNIYNLKGVNIQLNFNVLAFWFLTQLKNVLIECIDNVLIMYCNVLIEMYLL